MLRARAWRIGGAQEPVRAPLHVRAIKLVLRLAAECRGDARTWPGTVDARPTSQTPLPIRAFAVLD